MAKLVVQFNRAFTRVLSFLAVRKGTTEVDVLRRSVALYKYLNDEMKKPGAGLVIRQGDTILKQVMLP